MTTAPADEFESHRTRLFGLAYRMLGSAEEAEDTVQDAYLRFSGADRTAIEAPGAWLAKVVTNLCLTRLTSARARRERYVGTWLPEPVATADGTLGPRLAELAAGAPAGRVEDMGGPEVRTFEELARVYLRARGKRRRAMGLPLAGRTYRAFRDGGHLTPGRAVGKGTFEEYLAARFGGKAGQK